MEVQNRIKLVRESRGILLHELADAIGKSRSTVQRYETGDIQSFSNEIILKMSEFLEVSPAYLMGWSDVQDHGVHIVPIVEEVNQGNYQVSTYRTIPKNEYDVDELMFLRIEDNSMLPLYKQGSKVLLHKNPNVEKGKYVGAIFDDSNHIQVCHYLKNESYDAFQTELMKRSGEVFIVDEEHAAYIVGEVIEE